MSILENLQKMVCGYCAANMGKLNEIVIPIKTFQIMIEERDSKTAYLMMKGVNHPTEKQIRELKLTDQEMILILKMFLSVDSVVVVNDNSTKVKYR